MFVQNMRECTLLVFTNLRRTFYVFRKEKFFSKSKIETHELCVSEYLSVVTTFRQPEISAQPKMKLL